MWLFQEGQKVVHAVLYLIKQSKKQFVTNLSVQKKMLAGMYHSLYSGTLFSLSKCKRNTQLSFRYGYTVF